MSVKPGELLALHAPTPSDAVKQRQGPGGRMLSYVDSRYVAQFLDDTVGPANWQRRSTIGPNGKVSCAIGIRVAQEDGVTEWVFKDDGADETDIEGAKGSFSDAFKRAAAISWGIARDLYGESTSGQRTSTARSPQAPPPVAPPAAGDEPPWAQPDPIPARPGPFAPMVARDAEGADVCPEHHLAWVLQKAGTSKNGKAYAAFWKCGHKGPPFCDHKPSPEWQARHETAA